MGQDFTRQPSGGLETADSRPSRTFLTADWRDLVLLSFAISAAEVRSFLPPGLEFDDFHGTAFVSIIGFQFLRTRILGLPIPFHGRFPEVNWRIYVRRNTPEGMRRGVVFLREFVPLRAVAFLARVLYNENYAAVPMNQKVSPGRSAAYEWTTGRKLHSIAARTILPPSLPAPDSLEAFIVEHHWGYAATPAGCVEYHVERPRWRTFPVDSFEMHIDRDPRAHGLDLPFKLPKKPDSVIFAEGSPVSVSFGRRIA